MPSDSNDTPSFLNDDTPERRDAASLGAGATEALRQLAGAGVVGIMLMTFDGRVLDANHEFVSLVGYSLDELRSGAVRWDEITPPEWRGVDERILRSLATTGEAKPLEKEFIHRDGQRVPVLVGGALLDPATTESIGFIVDLTAQRAAESALRLRSKLLDLSYDAVLVWSLDEHGAGPIRLWNRGAETLYGFAREEAIGRTSHELLHTTPTGTTLAAMESALREHGEWSGELTHRTRSGQEVIVDARLQVLHDADGTPLVLETNRDITRRRAAERAAAAAQARLASIVQNADVAIISKTLDGLITSWNTAAERLFGYTASEMIGRPIMRIIPPELQAEEAEIIARIARGDSVTPCETLRMRKDGTRFAASITVSPVRDSSGTIVGASKILRDISAQREAEAARARSEALFRDTFEQAAVGIAHVSLDGQWLRINDRLAEILGYTRDELLALTFQDITHPDDLQADLDQVRAMLRGEITRYAMDKRYIGNGNVPVWARLTVSLVRGERGEPDYFVSVVEDARERHAAMEALERANAAKSEFLATMSHELRTPLNAIAGYVSLVTDGVYGPVADAQRDALERVQRAQRHLLGLVNDVLNFARIESGTVAYDATDFSLVDPVTEVARWVEPQFDAKGVTFRNEIAPDAPARVHADVERVRQILLNLLSNAVKFTRPGGEVTVSLAADAHDGSRVMLLVRDTGMGIAPEELETIFEPFVQLNRSLSSPVDGTGLGLAISRDLARGMGGDLVAQSSLGEGSTFVLTLPGAAESRHARSS